MKLKKTKEVTKTFEKIVLMEEECSKVDSEDEEELTGMEELKSQPSPELEYEEADSPNTPDQKDIIDIDEELKKSIREDIINKT